MVLLPRASPGLLESLACLLIVKSEIKAEVPAGRECIGPLREDRLLTCFCFPPGCQELGAGRWLGVCLLDEDTGLDSIL